MLEWKTKTLGELAETQLGKMLNTGNQTGEYKTPYLRSLNVQWGGIDTSHLNEMDIPPTEHDKYTVKKGDLLICEGGESGRAAIWNSDETIGFQNALHRVRSKNEVTNKYLLYYFEWLVKNRLIDHLFNGVTIRHFPQENLRSVNISYPSIDKQLEIVELLESYFSLLNNALKEAHDARAKASQFKVAFLRTVCKGDSTWESFPLKQLGIWGGGGTPSKANIRYWTNGTVPWLTPKDMGPTEIFVTRDKITEEACINSAVKKIPANSVVFVVRSGILERKLPVAITRVETTLNQDMKSISFFDHVNSKFAFYALLGLEQDILNKCKKSGTTVASINTESLMKYEIKIPELSIQNEIVAYVESQFSLTDKTLPWIESVIQDGHSLRQSLLQAAFTGQLTKEVERV